MAAGNILLASAPEAPHGFRAKVGDFGLARQLLAVRSRVTTNSYGCINYLAPEVFTEGRLSKVSAWPSLPCAGFLVRSGKQDMQRCVSQSA